MMAIGLIIAAAWEAYWLYEYIAAPRPDCEMRSVAAVVLGGLPPLVLIWAIMIVAAVNGLLRRFRC
jgi:hypothetical protein